VTPWIAVVLIFSALLFLARRRTSPSRSRMWVSKPIQPEKAFTAAYAVIEAAFKLVHEGTTLLDLNDTIILAADNLGLQSAKLSWMVAIMALEQAHPGFRNGYRFESMRLIAFMEFKRHLQSNCHDFGREASSKVVETAVSEVAACTGAFDHTSARLIANHPHPLNPIFAEIERSYRFAAITASVITNDEARLDAAYGPVFRNAFQECRAAG